MATFDQLLCDEKHDNIKTILIDHETRLNNHSGRINNLEKDGREYQVSIKNLIKKMDTFITVMMSVLGVFVTVCIFIISTVLKK